jgi:hypothetical protein
MKICIELPNGIEEIDIDIPENTSEVDKEVIIKKAIKNHIDVNPVIFDFISTNKNPLIIDKTKKITLSQIKSIIGIDFIDVNYQVAGTINNFKGSFEQLLNNKNNTIILEEFLKTKPEFIYSIFENNFTIIPDEGFNNDSSKNEAELFNIVQNSIKSEFNSGIDKKLEYTKKYPRLAISISKADIIELYSQNKDELLGEIGSYYKEIGKLDEFEAILESIEETEQDLQDTNEDEEASDIYKLLGNKSANVKTTVFGKDSGREAVIKQQGGIDVLYDWRAKNKDTHFGNKFTSEQTIYQKHSQDLIKTTSTKESVVKYIDWIINSTEPRAEWVREQLLSGRLKGQPLHYTNTTANKANEPSHATALDFLINDPRSPFNQSENKTQPLQSTSKPKLIKNEKGLIIIENAIPLETTIKLVEDNVEFIKDTSFKQTGGSVSWGYGHQWIRSNTLTKLQYKGILVGKEIGGQEITELMKSQLLSGKDPKSIPNFPLYVYTSIDKNGNTLPDIPTEIITELANRGIDISEYDASYNSVYDKNDKGSLVIHQDNTEFNTSPIITISAGRPMKFITYQLKDSNNFNFGTGFKNQYEIRLNTISNLLIANKLAPELSRSKNKLGNETIVYGQLTPSNLIKYSDLLESKGIKVSDKTGKNTLQVLADSIEKREEFILSNGALLVFSNENRNVFHEIVFDKETDKFDMPKGFPELTIDKGFNGKVKTKDYRVVWTLRKVQGKKVDSVNEKQLLDSVQPLQSTQTSSVTNQSDKDNSTESVKMDNSNKPIFNSLPAKLDKPTMTYAGIGSRETPEDVLNLMTEAAKYLESLGYTLNTGKTFIARPSNDPKYQKQYEERLAFSKKNNGKVGLDEEGADRAFSLGTTKKNLFGVNAPVGKKELTVMEEIHPAPDKLTEGAKKLMARNTNQIFGENLDTPVDFVLFYAKETSNPLRVAGGTGQAVEMARRKRIPTINMSKPNWKKKLDEILNNNKSITTEPVNQTITKPENITESIPKVKSFITERGSIYTLLPDNRYQRFKTVDGVAEGLKDPTDIMLFYNESSQTGKAMYHFQSANLSGGHPTKITLLHKNLDGTYTRIDNNTELQNTNLNNVILLILPDGFIENNNIPKILTADKWDILYSQINTQELISKQLGYGAILNTEDFSNFPKLGLYTFEWLVKDGKQYGNKSHTGNKIISIEYNENQPTDSITSNKISSFSTSIISQNGMFITRIPITLSKVTYDNKKFIADGVELNDDNSMEVIGNSESEVNSVIAYIKEESSKIIKNNPNLYELSKDQLSNIINTFKLKKNKNLSQSNTSIESITNKIKLTEQKINKNNSKEYISDDEDPTDFEKKVFPVSTEESLEYLNFLSYLSQIDEDLSIDLQMSNLNSELLDKLKTHFEAWDNLNEKPVSEDTKNIISDINKNKLLLNDFAEDIFEVCLGSKSSSEVVRMFPPMI